MGILQDDLAGDIGSVPRCRTCGSERVVKDAWACWNPENGLWELEGVFDETRCRHCEAQTSLSWYRPAPLKNKRIRELNDQFRRSGQGRGSIMLTQGIQGMGGDFVQRTLVGVRAFDAFSEETDPWGEHDFGALEIDGEKVFFKIDYYTPDLTAGSENPANGGETHRVLTIMLASEY